MKTKANETRWEEKTTNELMVKLSGGLLIIRGVPVKVVGHEKNIRSRWDEGMARFHNLKAQETEGAHQFS